LRSQLGEHGILLDIRMELRRGFLDINDAPRVRPRDGQN